MREFPLQNYFVRLRNKARPSGGPPGGTIILGDTQLGGPGKLAVDVRTSMDIETSLDIRLFHGCLENECPLALREAPINSC